MKKLLNLESLSLCKVLKLDDEQYLTMLEKCTVARRQNSICGMKVHFNERNIRILIDNNSPQDVELEPASPPDSDAQVYYLQLEPKQSGYHKSVNEQVNHISHFEYPRCRELHHLLRRLRRLIRNDDPRSSDSDKLNDDSRGTENEAQPADTTTVELAVMCWPMSSSSGDA